MKSHKYISQIHKFVGLVIGIQILLWTAGGFVMSFFDIERVRGEHLIAAQAPQPVPPAALPASVRAVAGNRDIDSVTLEFRFDRPLAEVIFADGSRALVDLASGRLLSPLDGAWVRRIAKADYAGDADIAAMELIRADPPQEYRGPLPVWHVALADDEETTLYISPETGRVLARRNDIWRLYDFFWMLHIMDYEERVDFNHPLLVTAAVIAFLMALSGILLLLWRLGRRDFAWIGIARTGRR
ncbi:MAG: PepSY domain-containing protein [Rhodothalassiaceae bacterium]